MSNANTIQTIQAGLGQPFVANLSLTTSTTETLFSNNTGVVATTLGGGVAILKAPLQGNVPSFYQGGQAIKVRGAGLVTTTGSTNVTLTLYNATAAQIAVAGGVPTTGFTLGSLKASTARAVNTATAPFWFEALLQQDQVGGRLVGQASFEINGLLDIFAATTIITGMSLTAADADLNFALSATQSSGQGALLTLTEFSVDRV